MKAIVMANRKLEDHYIIEIFSWKPSVRYSTDPQRQLYHMIHNHICSMSMHKYGYKLLDIIYERWRVIYKYEIPKESLTIPQLSEIVSFEYFPILGEKKCYKCDNYKCYKGTEYCYWKGTKLKRNAHYRCLDFIESTVVTQGLTANVYQHRRPEGNGGDHRKILRSGGRRKISKQTDGYVNEPVFLSCR